MSEQENASGATVPCISLLAESDYDSGYLNDYGGGNVGWWQDYIRAEVGRCNDYWRARLQPSPEAGCSEFCTWKPDDDGNWETTCGNLHVFFDGTPHQNSYGFCPYCGKRLAQNEGEDHE
jgi:hypothetical protein